MSSIQALLSTSSTTFLRRYTRHFRAPSTRRFFIRQTVFTHGFEITLPPSAAVHLFDSEAQRLEAIHFLQRLRNRAGVSSLAGDLHHAFDELGIQNQIEAFHAHK